MNTEKTGSGGTSTQSRPSSINEWFRSLSNDQQWAHCGDRKPHASHTHTIVFNEGPYPDVPCIGTPRLSDVAASESELEPKPRPSWDDVWIDVSMNIASRSLCVRAKVGAVIVDGTNRIVSTGYNGPPSGFDHGNLECTEWCGRASSAAYVGSDKMLKSDYSDCPALHAEANALMAADRSTWQGGTIYVLGDVCFSCAKLIANSGLSDVVVHRDEPREYRNPTHTYKFLERCGITVVVE